MPSHNRALRDCGLLIFNRPICVVAFGTEKRGINYVYCVTMYNSVTRNQCAVYRYQDSEDRCFTTKSFECTHRVNITVYAGAAVAAVAATAAAVETWLHAPVIITCHCRMLAAAHELYQALQ